MILLPISSSFLVELQQLAEYDVAKVQGIEDAVNIDLHLHHLYCLLLLEVCHLRFMVIWILKSWMRNSLRLNSFPVKSMTQFKFLTIQTRQTSIKRARARDVYSALKLSRISGYRERTFENNYLEGKILGHRGEFTSLARVKFCF